MREGHPLALSDLHVAHPGDRAVLRSPQPRTDRDRLLPAAARGS